MNERYPGVRVHLEDGPVWVRHGLIIRFFMHRSHGEFASGVLRALDTYRQAVGPETLAWYPDMEGDWQPLDDTVWEQTHQALLANGTHIFATLVDQPDGAVDYRFEYEGISLEEPGPFDDPRRACIVTFWVPTAFVEKEGPEVVRALAMDLAAHLPFNSGYASLAFNTSTQPVDVTRQLDRLCFRHPGVDVLEHRVSWDIGTRVPGAYWLTFLGQPVLGELGGVDGLRARLSSPGTTVQQLAEDRAVITLGLWPEAGDLESGDTLPAYRELARVLEPWLYHDPNTVNDHDFPPEDKLRWERRFLD
jgi:hypothetical protein